MDNNIRKQWVDKLRSGEYPQAKGVLRKSDGGFCCLGVLCELAVEQKVIEPPTLHGSSYFYQDDKSDDAYDAWLPPTVRKWAGLQTDEVRLAEYRVVNEVAINTLSAMNDRGLTFTEIADFIESDDFVEAVDKSK